MTQQYYHPQSDFYRKVLKTTPPSTEVHEEEDIIRAEFKKQLNAIHNWKQKGNIIFCDFCPNEHGNAIPVDRILTGTDKKGHPQLKVLDIGRDK